MNDGLSARRQGLLARGVFPAALIVACIAWTAAPGLVISEINYHPHLGQETLEFIEISSDFNTPEDLSGYAFVEGISYEFPAGTILPAHGILVVCADSAAVKARYSITNALGNFSGKLENSGESIKLVNQAGIVVQSLRYRDRGKWPATPDGTGHSLVLRNLHLDPKEPESWTQSPELGGSPGKPNFSTATDPVFVDEVIIPAGETWKYAKGTQDFSTPSSAWHAPDFDDAGWLEGAAGFGYGDNDDRTVLADMLNLYTSVACRKRFTLTAEQLALTGDFQLGIDYDDGFCAWLNGVEIGRVNCGTPGVDLAFNAVATGSREIGVEETFAVPRGLLKAGNGNVLAIVGFNFSIGSSDFSLNPRLLVRRLRDPAAPEAAQVVLNELYRSPSAGQSWVEIYNPGSAPADLGGYLLTDDAARADPYRFPAGTQLAPHGFLVLDEASSLLGLGGPEVHLFLLATDGRAATASVFERLPPAGWAGRGYSEARLPDGGPLDWVTLTPTPGAPNQVARTTDVVINEIFYHPPEGRTGEFLELYNRGSNPVDLSGFRFDKGIDYTFAAGTVMAPGGYLVLTEDPAILAENYGLSGALGPYTGQLSNTGENLRLVDAAGNLVNEVRYHDGGSWPEWADGGGSSVELIDPAQDNSVASAWDSSDETEKAPWENLAYTVPTYVVASQSELHLFLVEKGVCRIDDVSITRGAGANLIPNPGFENATTAPWVIQGTHVRSKRITTDSHQGTACLEVNASSKGDTQVNRLEVETNPRLAAGVYDISLWARWLRGTSLIISHGEFTAGAFGGRPSPATNLSGNTLGGQFRMSVPLNLGTPGAENSARRRLREKTGGVNLGPVIDQVDHRPPSPSADRTVTVRARVQDSDGVQLVQAFYRAGSPNGAFTAVQLFDDGLHDDDGAGDALHGGQFPGFANLTKIVFYLEATDRLGATRRFPVDAPTHTCLYQVQGPVESRLENCRVVLDDARMSELQSRPLHSNDLLPGAFVFNDEEVYYNIGVRYRGSPWGRPSRTLYRVKFEADHPYFHDQKVINLSSRGAAPNEGAAYFLVGRNSGPGTPTPAPDYRWVRAWLNGQSLGTYGLLQPQDTGFLQKWYGDNATGPVLKGVGRLLFDDAGAMTAWDGASFIHMGVNTENYRGYFLHSVHQTLDNWEPFFDLTRIMDRRRTPDAAFDTQIDTILNVEAFLRVQGPRILMSDWDAFGIGNGHNGYMAFDIRDGRWGIFPFDEDNTFSNATPNLFGIADDSVARMLSRPGPKRAYYRILWEYLAGYWSTAAAAPFLDAVQSATGVGTGGIKSYIGASAPAVRSLVLPFTNAKFRITSNGGVDFTTQTNSTILEGDAPVQIQSIVYQKNAGEELPLEATWTTPTHWRQTFSLEAQENLFEFLGFDSAGTLLGTAKIRVTNTSGKPVFVRGDSSGDRELDLGDAMATLFYLFLSQPLRCLDAADSNDDGKIDLSDVLGVLGYLFTAGPPPALPFPAPGSDASDDSLGCTG